MGWSFGWRSYVGLGSKRRFATKSGASANMVTEVGVVDADNDYKESLKGLQ